MARTPHSVGDILDSLEELAEENDEISVRQVMGAFGTRTFGPAIIVPALLEITPIGAVPGVPSVLAVVIILVALQKLAGRRSLWLPGIIANRCVSGEKLRTSAEKLRPLARFMDRHFHRRLKAMTRAPFSQIAAGIVVLLCLTVPFLEVLPFASSVPMLAIAGFGVAVLARDGMLMLVALAASFVALGLGFDYWDGGISDTEQTDGMVTEETFDAAKQKAAEAGDTVRDASEKAGDTVREAGEKAADAVQSD
ncbi:exopolysaccharide biosynthesis protein [Aurantiacibacter poecillastricola]|uniref:exopolysaccharide biosynthesis protein n=1 Tax=Aurantiacibacter poecillastricola TaxID=3064385 RepID=UPI00274021E7|nr:exopolysaccharide biosynthesis protein [Aurantiacibacter sp. 219JJ12-13]MDP5260437.1 exopolysaccharide biosynthesis protein [Aurantiacibacter sp. 219JJ12-13]